MRRTIFFATALFLTALAAQGQPAAPALLRQYALVHGPSVLLSDLFVDAPGIVAFPSPPPGRRIVLEPPQVAAVARAHGIAWRPLPGAERVVVERPGAPLSREAADAALRTALVPLGIGADDGFDLATAMPIVPAAAEPIVAAEDAVLDRATGRFSATLVLDSGDGPPARMRVIGRAWPGVVAAVPVRRLAAGQPIRPEDIRIERVRADRAAQLADPAAVAGQAPRRPIAAGQPLAQSDLARPAVILRNSAVLMSIAAPGMSILAQGKALEDGAPGETIRVQNVLSRAVLAAEVVGPGRVRVMPGSMPIERLAPGQNPSPVRH